MEWISQILPESLVASTRPFVCPLVKEVFPCGSSSLYNRWNREEALLYNGARVCKIEVRRETNIFSHLSWHGIGVINSH